MASIYTSKAAPIRGPYLKHAFAKSVLKGEDAWLQQRDLQVSVPATAGESRFCECMFCIFEIVHALIKQVKSWALSVLLCTAVSTSKV